MTDEEKRRAFERARLQVLKARTAIQRDTRGEIVRLLEAAAARINAMLAGQPSDYQLWQLGELQREIGRTLAELGGQAASGISSAAGEAWEAGQELIERPLAAGGIRVLGAAPAINTQQLFAMRTFMADRIKDIALTAANQINSELGLVVIGAQTTADAVGKVTAILGESSRARATTIVRTELGRVFSVAANERMQQAAPLLPGLKKQWRRSGKLHSRFHHDAADGQVQPVDKPFVLQGPNGRVTLRFPRDPLAPAGETINCGCESLPIMDSWDVAQPGRRPFTPEEIARNRLRAELGGAAA